MASKADEYRANAAECHQWAAAAQGQDVKAKSEELARNWSEMAEKGRQDIPGSSWPILNGRSFSWWATVLRSGWGFMAAPKIDKHKEYARYAAHCLDMATSTRDRETRVIQREMAAERLRLADEFMVRQ